MRKALWLKLTFALALALATSSSMAETARVALPGTTTCSSSYCIANPSASCVWFGKTWNCEVWLDSHCC